MSRTLICFGNCVLHVNGARFTSYAHAFKKVRESCSVFFYRPYQQDFDELPPHSCAEGKSDSKNEIRSETINEIKIYDVCLKFKHYKV